MVCTPTQHTKVGDIQFHFPSLGPYEAGWSNIWCLAFALCKLTRRPEKNAIALHGGVRSELIHKLNCPEWNEMDRCTQENDGCLDNPYWTCNPLALPAPTFLSILPKSSSPTEWQLSQTGGNAAL